jgi:signal peptidase I
LNPEEFVHEGQLISPLFNPREQVLDSVRYCSYSGPSMNPTLRDGDLLEVEGYGIEPVRIGDVVLFKKESSSRIVVHRVIGLSAEGLVTRGDDNLENDPGLLDSRDVIGRIIAYWRGQRRRTVLRGRPGMILARFTRCRIRSTLAIFTFFSPHYRFVSAKGFLRVISPVAEPRVVRFGDKDLRLILWSHEIGRYKEGVGWLIRPPFKLIVNETSLREVEQPDDPSRG